MYISKIVRTIALGFLLLLPFTRLPHNLFRYAYNLPYDIPYETYPQWFRVFDLADKMSGFLFLFLVITFCTLKPEYFKIPRLPLTRWLIIFFFYSLAIGCMNGVPFVQAIYGTIDLIRYFPFLYLFAMLKFGREEFFRAIKLLIQIGVILAVVGLWGLILALSLGLFINLLVIESGRFIPYQIISLAGYESHIALGLYATLLFLLAYSQKHLFARFSQIFLFLLMFFTVSRQSWISFLLLYSLFKRRKFMLILLPAISLVVIFSLGHKLELNPKSYYRLFVFLESINILQEHPLTGIGPGRFGDTASFKFGGSPEYDSWPKLMRDFAFKLRGLDMFWPMVWGELGLIGLALYGGALISLFSYLKKAALSFRQSGNAPLFNVGKALQYYLVIFLTCGFALGLQYPLLLYPYFALVGIFVSLYEELNQNKESSLVSR